MIKEPGNKWQDFSVWLDMDKNYEKEYESWQRDKLFVVYADAIENFKECRKINTIFEFGCGAGFVPRYLRTPIVRYLGVDNSFNAIASAQTDKEVWMDFVVSDIREYPNIEHFDLACSFAVLKHFSLGEWPAILKKFLSFGRLGLFTMQLSKKDRDDGGFENDSGPYHHIWITDDNLRGAVFSAGHRVITVSTHWEGMHHGTVGKEVIVMTEEQ